MEPNNRSVCGTHKKPIQMICPECKQLMCYRCLAPHDEQGRCKGRAVDLLSYAEKSIMPQLLKSLQQFEPGGKKGEGAAKVFADALTKIEKSLREIKGRTEQLLAEIDRVLTTIEGSQYMTMKETIEQQIEYLKNTLKNENMDLIVKGVSDNLASIGDSELQLSGATVASVNKVSLGTHEFDALGECLQKLVATCQNVLKRRNRIEITSRFVYGICHNMDSYKKLCRYNIVTKGIAQCIAVPQYCSVQQMGKQIFLSGGFNPLVNTVSEFIEKTQSIAEKAPMNYKKYVHTTVAVSDTQFMAIGGNDGTSNLSYCEEYSILDNAWQVLSQLNQARHSAAAVLSDDSAYLYVIGGFGCDNVIEIMDMKEKKVWNKIALSGATEVSLCDHSAAFSISKDNIMMFVGGNTDCAIYNTKLGTVKKLPKLLKIDYYQTNQVCVINGNAYVMGDFGHMHIYKYAESKIEEVDYSDAISA